MFQQDREGQVTLLRKALAALCLFLVVLVGAAQLLHVHPANAPSEANCSLCVVAHLSASPAPVVAGPALAAGFRSMAPPDAVAAVSRTALLAYSIRPPPALSPHA